MLQLLIGLVLHGVLILVVFFAILTVIVVIHELGHFLVARLFGVRVEEFGFGLPPRALGKKIGKTIYSINWLPFGGFVRLAGEDEDEGRIAKGYKRSEYFWAKNKLQKTAVLLAGVTMNFILAVGVSTYLLTQGVYETSGRVHIQTVVAGGPAAKAGIEKGDIIQRVSYLVNGVQKTQDIKTPNQLVLLIRSEEGERVTMTIDRSGKILPITMVPRKTFPKGEGPTGIAISDLELKKYSLSQAPQAAFNENVSLIGDLFSGIRSLFQRISERQPVGNDVVGPIGIADIVGKTIQFGFNAELNILGYLSLSLAVLNLLPFPGLDGGRILFVFLQKLLGKRLKPAFERSTHQIGFIILIILVAIISYNDILRLARGG